MLLSGRIIPTIGEPPTPLSFDSVLEWSCHLGVSFSLQIGDQGLVEFDLSPWTHLILISLCYALVLMAESEEELKSLLMKVKVESEKVGLKLNIQKMKSMASGPITSWAIDGERVETVSDFILGGSKITADGDCSHEIKRRLLLGRKVMTILDSIFHGVAKSQTRLSDFIFTFCHKGGVICISEVIDISPCNLDSSLYFLQPGISHDVLCM